MCSFWVHAWVLFVHTVFLCQYSKVTLLCSVLFYAWGTQGASRVAPGKFSLHSSCKGEHCIALESWQGNRASICFEGGISRSFWSCSRKPWLPSTCDSDLREFLRVFMGSQEYCGVGGDSWDCTGVGAKEEGLISSWGGENGALLDLWWETQCSSRVGTGISWTSGVS